MQMFLTMLSVLLLTLFRTTLGILLSLLLIFLVLRTLPDLFISTPVLRIDPNGIQTSNQRNNRFGLISWEDIVKIDVGVFIFNRFLMIEVNDPEKFRSRVSADKGKLLAPLFQDPSPYISLSFDFMTPSLDKAIEYIKSHHPDKLASNIVKT
ncbi:MAG: STM3941 family protein [Anaerolineales bacterium]|nr:MAG: STM3941 family protein [Anaerolineales bacterium]